jgi:hypothetical protein
MGWPESVILTVPDGWSARSALRGAGLERTDEGRLAELSFGSVDNLVADPCASGEVGPLLEPPIGAAVDDLAAGLRALPGLEFSEPVAVTLAGWEGVRMQQTHPATCETGGFTPLWVTPPEGGERWTVASRAGWHSTYWILDIGGLRFAVVAAYERDAPRRVRDELEQIVQSIVIER